MSSKMHQVLWAGNEASFEPFRPELLEAFKTVPENLELVHGPHDPARIAFMLYAPNGPIKDFSSYGNLRLIQSLWAGVDGILGARMPMTAPLARMADEGMAQGMADYVVGHVLRHHLNTDLYHKMGADAWLDHTAAKLSSERQVAILGLGHLGQFCAYRLLAQGFAVCGWSRTEKHLTDIPCFHGDAGLKAILKQSEIVVLLLPRTPQTENIIARKTLSYMPKGASLINAGRGELICDEDLLEALDQNHISQATLDVFREEPLPKTHPYRHHPSVLVTPHIAAETRVKTAARFAAENIARVLNGQPARNLVDHKLGY